MKQILIILTDEEFQRLKEIKRTKSVGRARDITWKEMLLEAAEKL